MDINSWYNSGNQNIYWYQSYVKTRYDRILSFNGIVNGSTTPRWKMLWGKIMKEKKRIFYCSSSTSVHMPYDPYTYAQNFDQGCIWADPDNASLQPDLQFLQEF